MVTVVGITAEGLGVYRGLSTDLPLDPAPKNGSRFFAMDNGKTYWYDAAWDTWEGYAGGGGSEALSGLNDVDTTGATAGDVLRLNGDTNKWEPGSAADPDKAIATVEGVTASRAYAIGETFIDSEGYTCMVTAAVSSGASWVLNTNYTRMTIGEMLYGTRLLFTAAQDGTKTRRQLASQIIGKIGVLNHRRRLIIVENKLVYHLHNEDGHNTEFVCVDINTSSAIIHTIGLRNDLGRCFDVNLLTQTITDDTSVAAYDMELYEI